MRKNTILNIVFLFICIPSLYISFKVFESYKIQKALIYEWDKTELIIPFKVVQKINHNFPNITSTALPMATVKSKYYMKEGLLDSALILLNEGIKQNPFLGVSSNLKSQIYLNQKMLDCAYVNAKKSFERLPNNLFHADVYFTTLAAKGMYDSLIEKFESIKLKESAVWFSFLEALKYKEKDYKTVYTKYLDSTLILFPKDKSFKKLKIEQEIGKVNIQMSSELGIQANEIFDKGDLKKAAELYNLAVKKNPYNYNALENYGITLFKLDSFDKASKFLKMKSKEIGDNGKSEFYLGVIYSTKNKDSSCFYFKNSFKKSFSQSELYLNNYCLN